MIYLVKTKTPPLTKLPIVKGKLYISSIAFMPYNAIARKNKNLAKGLGLATVAAVATGVGVSYKKDRKRAKEKWGNVRERLK